MTNPAMKTSISFGCTTSTGGMKKNISFGSNTTRVFNEKISDNQKNALWYSAKDYQNIKQNMKLSYRKEGYQRGLETFKSRESIESRSDQVKLHVQQLLELQREHQELGLKDDKGLSMLSTSLSRDNLKKAQKIATKDSTDAFSQLAADETVARYLKAKNAEEYAKKIKLKNVRTARSLSPKRPPSSARRAPVEAPRSLSPHRPSLSSPTDLNF